MKIKIDEKEILVSDATKNIVQIAEENGITIIAPCYRSSNRRGCCKACLIETNGNETYACGTRPEDGMTIVYKREDLEAIRKERLASYAQSLKENKNNDGQCCDTGSSCCDTSSDCSDTSSNCCDTTSDCCS